MNAIEFVNAYPDFLREIEKIMNPNCKNAMAKMRDIDPHDLVSSDTYFANISHARGYVFTLFLEQVKNRQMKGK